MALKLKSIGWTFIQNMVSVCEIEFSDKKETETKERFQSKVNEYLKQSLDIEKLNLNAFLDPNKKEPARSRALFF